MMHGNRQGLLARSGRASHLTRDSLLPGDSYAWGLSGNLSAARPIFGTMRTLVVLELDIDEGVRPSTGSRRLDVVARSLGERADRLRHVRSVESVRVCEPSQLVNISELIRYDGAQFRPSTAVLVR